MRYVLVLIGLIIFAGTLFLWNREIGFDPEQKAMQVSKSTATIHDYELQLEIARTPEEQSRGLSGRESLAENAGMLFLYEKPLMPGFWMKDMNFAIDIIWIDEEKKIVGMNEGITPETFPEIFYPPSPVQYVLEVNANWAKAHDIGIGDQVIFHGIF